MVKLKIDFGVEELRTLRLWRAVIAELLGTMFFLLAVCLVAQPWGNTVDSSALYMKIGFGIGLSITTSAVMIGHVSGGHLNPAVSLGAIFGGRISVLKGLLYIPAQVVGGIAGSGLAYGLSPDNNNLGVVGLGGGVTPAQGFGLELLFTFLLVFFVLSITDDLKKIEPYAVALGIGVCIVVCHLFLIPMTGCGINPARAFGPAVIMNQWGDHWCYWAGPMVAAPLAALVYRFVFFHEVNSIADSCTDASA